MKYSDAKYMLGAAKVKQLPDDIGIEVAFAGRSNAGKSSAINTLTNQKSLARVSKTPGRTQLLNLFSLDQENYKKLVDLPGYGYAKVSASTKRVWQREMEDYISNRQCLKGIVLLVDSRHELKEFDCLMIEMAVASEMKLHILLTKADKLNNKQKSEAIMMIKSFLFNFKNAEYYISYQVFSSLTKLGLYELESQLDEWYLAEED